MLLFDSIEQKESFRLVPKSSPDEMGCDGNNSHRLALWLCERGKSSSSCEQCTI